MPDPILPPLYPDPWANAGPITPPSIEWQDTGGLLFNITPYPDVPPTVRLNTYSFPGYRLKKLASRPRMREIYGYGEQHGPTDQMITRVFDVPWGARRAAINWWLGFSGVRAFPPEPGVTGRRFQLDGILKAQSSNVIILSESTENLQAGWRISGDGIRGGTTIQSVSSLFTIQISASATQNGMRTLTITDPNADATAYSVSRVLPDQVPTHPWLYAQDARLIELNGQAIVQDPLTRYFEAAVSSANPTGFTTDPAKAIDPNKPFWAPMPYYTEKVPGAYAQLGPLTAQAVTVNGVLTEGSNTIAFALGVGNTSQLQVGMLVSGVGVPAGSILWIINNAQEATMSLPADETGAVTLTFTPFGEQIAGDRFYEGVARYAVTYRPLPYEALTDDETYASIAGELGRYVDRQITYSVKAQPLPASIQFKYVPDLGLPIGLSSTSIQGTPQLILPGMQVRYRWVDVPDMNNEAIRRCVGRVNAEPFDGAVGWPAYPPETLLCHAPQTRRYRDHNGTILWEITYIFDRSPDDRGWNAFLAADNDGNALGYFRAGLNGKADTPLYRPANFNQLFSLPQRP